MFGSIGGPELLLILLLALMLFGPRRLPQIGRGLGRALAEFRSVSNEFKANLEREVDREQLKERSDVVSNSIAREPESPEPPEPPPAVNVPPGHQS